MRIELTAHYTATTDDTVLIFLTDEMINGKDSLPDAYLPFSGDLSLSIFSPKKGEPMVLPRAQGPSIILCSTGAASELTVEKLRKAAAAVADRARGYEIETLTIPSSSIAEMSEKHVVTAVAEGITLANYSFDRYKTKEDDRRARILKLRFISSVKLNKELERVEVLSRITHETRDLVNENSDATTALDVVTVARNIAKHKSIKIKVFNKRAIERMNMGLLLAVNQGSATEPRLVVLEYRGEAKSKKSIALVGKGVTFDSGGMNLKPTGGIETMRMDMAGASMALHTLKAAAELKLKVNLWAVLPLTDNMISAHAYRPGDVIKGYDGTTVEIGNTDAEGRLILADAISYTREKLKPSMIIDMATLTGACVMTFGEHLAGLVTSSESIESVLRRAGEATGDRVWPLPMLTEYEEMLKSDIADIKNISGDKYAGTITAAAFLKRFVGDMPWAHLDIAGTAWYSSARGYRPKNATGFGVRLLVEALEELYRLEVWN